MDFHGVARRELQALCKKNKIPANITNVAMADALSALPHVEGIEEIMQLQSPEKVGITSKTGLTSTWGRKTATKEPESSQPVSRSRLGSRRRITEDPEADEIKQDELETPAARKRAPVAASSRRKKVEESSVQKVYSTRRSVRLAEKLAGLSLDEDVEKSEPGNIGCDLSKDNFVNYDKGSDNDSEKKAVTEEALDGKVDMKGVINYTSAGDDEIDVNDDIAIDNAKPDLRPDVIPNVEMKPESEVEKCTEEAKAETKEDVGCEELHEVNDLMGEDTEEAIIASSESAETKGSDSSPVTTVFNDAEISDSNSTHPDALLESVGSSPTELMADNLSGSSATLESELSTKEESEQALENFHAMEPELQVEEEKPNGIADSENSFQNLSVSSDKLESTKEEFTKEESELAFEDLHAMEPEFAVGEEKPKVIAADSENSFQNLSVSSDKLESTKEEFTKEESELAFEDLHAMEPEFAVEEEKPKGIAADSENSCQNLSEVSDNLESTNEESEPALEDFHTMELQSVTIEEKSSDIANAENPFQNAETSPLEKQSIEAKHEKMKMELKDFGCNDKENFDAYDEKMKMKLKKQNMPYGNMSLRQLTKMLKAFHIDNNGKKNDDHQNVAVKDQLAKTTRAALQALPENQMADAEKEN